MTPRSVAVALAAVALTVTLALAAAGPAGAASRPATPTCRRPTRRPRGGAEPGAWACAREALPRAAGALSTGR